MCEGVGHVRLADFLRLLRAGRLAKLKAAMKASAILLLAVGARASNVKVSTYEALEGAVLAGEHKILVESDITFAAPIEIPAGKNIRIYSKGTRKTLDGNGETQLFRVDGTLTLQNLVLAEGYATNGFCSYAQNSGEECGGGGHRC